MPRSTLRLCPAPACGPRVLHRVRRQLTQAKIGDLDQACATAASGGDDKFDTIGVSKRVVLSRSPSECDLSFLYLDETPRARKLEIATLKPPDVVAAGVGQLDLKIVYGCIRAQIE